MVRDRTDSLFANHAVSRPSVSLIYGLTCENAFGFVMFFVGPFVIFVPIFKCKTLLRPFPLIGPKMVRLISSLPAAACHGPADHP